MPVVTDEAGNLRRIKKSEFEYITHDYNRIISDIIKRLCLKQNISFKWPNDVFVNGRKICGILQELITLNEKNFLIVGMGVNISE